MENTFDEIKSIYDESYYKEFLKKSGCNFVENITPINIPPINPQKIEKYFGENQETVINVLIPIISKYLQKEIILDSFEDHHERRGWRQNLPCNIRKYYENKNKIRGNNITCVLGAISLLSENTQDKELGQQFEKEYQNLVVDPQDPQKRFEYNDLTIDEKIKFSKELDNTALKILEMLC